MRGAILPTSYIEGESSFRQSRSFNNQHAEAHKNASMPGPMLHLSSFLFISIRPIELLQVPAKSVSLKVGATPNSSIKKKQGRHPPIFPRKPPFYFRFGRLKKRAASAQPRRLPVFRCGPGNATAEIPFLRKDGCQMVM